MLSSMSLEPINPAIANTITELLFLSVEDVLRGIDFENIY